ncbi:MAG: OmpA family protein [Sphingomonadales bacterium]|nr:OmpA family protein [Sphingomonadales bacterium]MBD3774631.1 OmpA family protein [Paracoccaceae bacterium]
MPAIASAQTSESDLLSLDLGSLRSEIETRYEAGLAATMDAGTVMANDSRYIWASETKVQCGIALGFLKSSTKDPASVSKCQKAYAMLTQPAPQPVPVAPKPKEEPLEVCEAKIGAIVFFDFDSSDVTSDAHGTLEYIANNFARCGWKSLSLVGHTDRSGSDAYNDALSMRRARSVEATLRGMNIAAPIAIEARGESQPRVPTADGVRELQNRRVEITGSK